MPSVADCLRQHGSSYLRDTASITLEQRRVLGAITRCRTGELGHVLFACHDCGRRHWGGRSCGNRHCPNCQHEKTQQWLKTQTDRLLPVEHFLVTCTVPTELRALLRTHPAEGYQALFDAGAATMRQLLADPKWLGSPDVGFFGVLHTWGRDPLVYHPHVHFVVPGGGVSADGTRWLATPSGFLFPEAVASRVYRQKFREALQAAGLDTQVDPSVWDRWWEISVQPVGDGQAVLKYLAPYVFRVAISNRRIRDCTESSVTYEYTPSKTRITRTRTVDGPQFVAGFLQHVLPKGFSKVRYFGWMAARSRTTRDRVKWLVWLFRGWTYWLGSGIAPQPEPRQSLCRCQHCGGPLTVVAITSANGSILLSRPLPNHATPFLDTG